MKVKTHKSKPFWTKLINTKYFKVYWFRSYVYDIKTGKWFLRIEFAKLQIVIGYSVP